MATADRAAVRSVERPEHSSTARAAWAAAWLLLVGTILHFLWISAQKYGHADSGAFQLFESRREWLWAHLAGGTLTLVVGPFQLLTPLRTAYPRVHRWTGRLYLLGLLVGCVGAAGLIATTPAGIAVQLAFAATELAWVFTAAMGFIAIRQRRLPAHRRWMARNYIVTFVFVAFRAMLLMPGVMALGPPSVMIPTLLWLGWVVPLLVHEAAIAAIGRRARPSFEASRLSVR